MSWGGQNGLSWSKNPPCWTENAPSSSRKLPELVKPGHVGQNLPCYSNHIVFKPSLTGTRLRILSSSMKTDCMNYKFAFDCLAIKNQQLMGPLEWCQSLNMNFVLDFTIQPQTFGIHYHSIATGVTHYLTQLKATHLYVVLILVLHFVVKWRKGKKQNI